jgi:RNA recognition motif-containing protein
MSRPWLSEREWLSKLNDSSALSEFVAAVNDCPASVQLHLMLVRKTEEPEDGLSGAFSSLAVWDLQAGHELWIASGSAETAKRATSIPYERSDLLASAFPGLKFAEPLKLPSDFLEFQVEVRKVPQATRLSLTRFKFEKELDFSPASWLNYLRFLERELPIASVLYEVAGRFVRARPDRKESWLAFMDAALMSGRFEEVLQVPAFNDCEEVLLCKMAALTRSQASAESMKQFILSASESSSNRKFIKFLASDALKRHDLPTFRAVWKHSLLKAHAKEAPLWLEYIRWEALSGAEDSCATITSSFKQALSAVSEPKDRKSLLTEWLNYDRIYGDSKSTCRIKARFIDDKEESEEIESETRRNSESTENSNQKRPRLQSTFNPQATLFANNLPYSFTQTDLESFMTPFTLKSVRMHMNGSTFKGHATMEFVDESTAAAALQSHNRRLVQDRLVFLSPYHSPFAPALPSALTTQDPKTLFISKLPIGVQEADLQAAFASLPGFREVRHVPGKSFAYVEFEDAGAAACALEKEKEILVAGEGVRMAISEPPIRKKADEQEKQKMLSMKPRSVRK